MKLTFLGAAREVTGSCYYLEGNGGRLLIDCGMEQGEDIYENQDLPVDPSQIDCVVLTHAHIDHSGKLPLLYKRGFRGPIYATEPTTRLCNLMLRDSAHIQEFEAEWRNRKALRAGGDQYVPLYNMQDAIGAIGLFRPVKYNDPVSVLPGLEARYSDAGHLLGSASVTLTDAAEGFTIVFSGDIGNANQPILNDPVPLKKADFVVMESTYGDRSHGPRPDYIAELSSVIQATFDRGGNVVIPSFAVGRTQEMLYFLRQIKAEGKVKGHGDFTVYVDSPLAVEATGVFQESDSSSFDEETRDLIRKGINPISFSGLKTSVTSDDSKAINFDRNPSVILSASGMCEAGRIRHHLKHNLWRPESTILFVGYQAKGTVGRALVEGAQKVKLFGEEIAVSAEIRVLGAVSGHADNAGLIQWISSFDPKPRQVFVTHGEEAVAQIFAGRLRDELGLAADVPYNGETWALPEAKMTQEGSRERALSREERRATERAPERAQPSQPQPGYAQPGRAQPAHYSPERESAYQRLVAAGDRLNSLIRRSDRLNNKNMSKLAEQILKLLDRWG
jgi:metallo-beta-lactamase family protein